MFGECEHGDTDVGEDEVLRHEVEKVKEVFGGLFGFFGEIVVGVVSLSYTTEENSNYSSQFKHLGNNNIEMLFKNDIC